MKHGQIKKTKMERQKRTNWKLCRKLLTFIFIIQNCLPVSKSAPIRMKRESEQPVVPERTHTCHFIFSNRTACNKGPYNTMDFGLHNIWVHGVLLPAIINNTFEDFIKFSFSQTDSRVFYVERCDTIEEVKAKLKQYIAIDGEFSLVSWSNTTLAPCKTVGSYGTEILDTTDPDESIYKVDWRQEMSPDTTTCSACDEDDCPIEITTTSRSKRQPPMPIQPPVRPERQYGPDPDPRLEVKYPPLPDPPIPLAPLVNTKHDGDDDACFKEIKKYKPDPVTGLAQETVKEKYSLWKILKSSYRTKGNNKQKDQPQIIVCISTAYLQNNDNVLKDGQECRTEEIEEFSAGPKGAPKRGSGPDAKRKVAPYFFYPRFRCGHCENFPQFQDVTGLDDHITSIHTNNRPFLCRRDHDRTAKINFGKALLINGWMAFAQLSSLKTHETHMHPISIDNLFRCPACNKGFAREIQVMWHYVMHETTRSFPCLEENCEMGPYKSQSALNSHFKNQHTADGGQEKVVCAICNILMAPRTLRHHNLMHSKHRDYMCPICDSNTFYETFELWIIHLSSEMHRRNFGGEDVVKPRPALCDPELYSEKMTLVYAEEGQQNPFPLFTEADVTDKNAQYTKCPNVKNPSPEGSTDHRGAVKRWYRPNVIGIRYRQYEWIVNQQMRCSDTTHYLYVEVVPEELCDEDCRAKNCQNKYYFGLTTTPLGTRENQHFTQSTVDGRLSAPFFTDCKKWIIFLALHTTENLIVRSANQPPNTQPALDSLWYAERIAIKYFNANKRVGGKGTLYHGVNIMPGGPQVGSEDERQWKSRMGYSTDMIRT